MSRFNIPIHLHPIRVPSGVLSVRSPSNCSDSHASGLLCSPTRPGQSAVQGIGRESALSGHDQAAVRQSRCGAVKSGARHLPLPHHGMMAPEAEPCRSVSGLALDCQMRGHAPADHAQSDCTAPRFRERPDRNRPWAIIGQVELCGRPFLSLRHRRTSHGAPSLARACDRSGHTPFNVLPAPYH